MLLKLTGANFMGGVDYVTGCQRFNRP